jgi:hypothetical protein
MHALSAWVGFELRLMRGCARREGGGDPADIRQGTPRAAPPCAHVGVGLDQERRDLEWPHR